MMIKTKKTVYDPKEPSDGLRILVMRMWPRGISKSKIDVWFKDLGTEPALIKRWKDKTVTWKAFTKEYLKGLQGKEALLEEVASLAKKKTITLLCSCKDEHHCHRSLLKEVLESI